jgi:hypothetical protein
VKRRRQQGQGQGQGQGSEQLQMPTPRAHDASPRHRRRSASRAAAAARRRCSHPRHRVAAPRRQGRRQQRLLMLKRRRPLTRLLPTRLRQGRLRRCIPPVYPPSPSALLLRTTTCLPAGCLLVGGAVQCSAVAADWLPSSSRCHSNERALSVPRLMPDSHTHRRERNRENHVGGDANLFCHRHPPTGASAMSPSWLRFSADLDSSRWLAR